MNKSATSAVLIREMSATNAQPTFNERAVKKQKSREISSEEIETSTNTPCVRFAFVPILQEFRQHTQRNQARLWIPVETSLLVRYEFASCLLQTRYIFVAIVLYCGANGLNEIPLDAKFMSSVLVADERTVQKSFDELLFKKLLLEKKREEKKREEKTDRQHAENNGAVSVDSEISFQTDSFNDNAKPDEIQKPEKPTAITNVEPDNETVTNKNSHNETVTNKNSHNETVTNKNSHNETVTNKNSIYSITECLKYVEACQAKGDDVKSPKALATHLHKTGEADPFILATLYPTKFETAEREKFGPEKKFSEQPCSVCYGAKMANADGKGYRNCEHCKNERGKSTGFEPKGENNE